MIEVNKFKNVLEVLDYFKEEATCKAYLEQRRWGGKLCCPKCGNAKIYHTNRGLRCANPKCELKFTVTVGTVMESSKIKLRYWFAAMYLISAHKKGISSHQIARDLGVTQKTAWFLNHRIRTALKDHDKTKLKGIVESDETYVGGKNKNRHGSKKKTRTQGRAPETKGAVIGLLERDGKVKTFHVPNAGVRYIKPILAANVEEGSKLMTDEWGGYHSAKEKFDHRAVNHSAKVFVDGIAHNNGVENYWSHLKRSITGVYHWVSMKHLQGYCDEMAYRFNSRKQSDIERFDTILSHTTGRLRWTDLVHGEKETIQPLPERKKRKPMNEPEKPKWISPPKFNMNDENVDFKSMREYLKHKGYGRKKGEIKPDSEEQEAQKDSD